MFSCWAFAVAMVTRQKEVDVWAISQVMSLSLSRSLFLCLDSFFISSFPSLCLPVSLGSCPPEVAVNYDPTVFKIDFLLPIGLFLSSFIDAGIVTERQASSHHLISYHLHFNSLGLRCLSFNRKKWSYTRELFFFGADTVIRRASCSRTSRSHSNHC